MTIRTFWSILIKVLGIWLILSGFALIPQIISMVGYLTYQEEGALQIILAIAGSLLALAVYMAILLYLVFKPGWLIDKLKLDKGFNQDTIDLNIRPDTTLTIAVIVIGGLMFVDGLPLLFREIIIFIREKVHLSEYPESGELVYVFFKTLAGYLIMTNSNTIVSFILKER